jgi:hypothetical protein
MKRVDELFDQAKELRPEELLRLASRLDEYASSLAVQSSSAENGRYARSLALAGIGHADWSDVSSNKGKYLSQAYARRSDE